jgi:GTPase SAR1 family protein
MAIVKLKKREIECKIVYYGPGRSGKTTNMEYMRDRM